jgi:hypothetical protein
MEFEHGRVPVYIASFAQHAPEILRKSLRGRADVNIRYIEFRLLGEREYYRQQTEQSNLLHTRNRSSLLSHNQRYPMRSQCMSISPHWAGNPRSRYWAAER